MPLLEIAVTSLEDAQNAVAGGANSIELSQDLSVGGVTPPMKLARIVRDALLKTRLYVLLRPHAHGFVYDRQEAEQMLAQIEILKDIGVDGIVFGALDEYGDLDIDLMKTIAQAAAPLPITLHRALDVCRSPEPALTEMVGVAKRVLTAGPAATAWEGRAVVRQWIERYGEHFSFVSAGSLRLDQLMTLIPLLRAHEYHFGSAARTDGVVDADKVNWLLNNIQRFGEL